MHGEIKDWNNGWFGMSLGMSASEIDRLIVLLKQLRNDPDQHFHISSDYSGSGGLGDIELFVAAPVSPNNLQLSGLAVAPESDLPSAGA